MKLYIAEKPSLAKAIANVLPKPHKNHKGYIEVGNGDVVSWCIGHILEQAQPEVYDAQYKKWHYEHLPIVPEKWQLIPKKTTSAQLSILKILIKKAEMIVHAGDPDREGQLLVDEVIDFARVNKTKKAQIQRLLINDLNTQAVKKALNNLQPNSDFMPLSISALARSRADWLYGINLTRALTIRGQKSGFNSVLSLGRVQTPVLGLVVERDQQIENFIPHAFYQVIAHLKTSQDQCFSALWQPSDACEPHMDEEKRIINKKLAEHVITRISDQTGIITKLDKKTKKLAPPLPFNLSTLQIDAAKRYSMNAKLVLDVCQALYEKHQLITYPRSDCRYLPNEHFNDVSTIIDTLKGYHEPTASYAKNANNKLKSKAWNSQKVSAHHAIIPTLKSPNKATLNTFEKNIYQLIAKQYLAQFYPNHEYEQQIIEVEVAGGVFQTKNNTVKIVGWRALYGREALNHETANKDNSSKDVQLPNVKIGDELHCQRGELLEKLTQAPKPFNDATLLAAMTNIARFVKEPSLKKQLKETDGLGTEATRAGIIDLLFKREYLTRVNKNIHSTPLGKSFINAIPKQTASPDMTAHWESTLNLISLKQSSYRSFMEHLTSNIYRLINEVADITFKDLPKIDKPTQYKKKSKRRSYSSTKYSKSNKKTTA